MNFEAHSKGTQYTAETVKNRLVHADEVYELFSGVAHDCGYAIARHGSGIRDIDLVAIPWTESAVSSAELVLQLASRLVLVMGKYSYEKPHGRATFAMWEPAWPTHQIDLSVMPLE